MQACGLTVSPARARADTNDPDSALSFGQWIDSLTDDAHFCMAAGVGGDGSSPDPPTPVLDDMSERSRFNALEHPASIARLIFRSRTYLTDPDAKTIRHKNERYNGAKRLPSLNGHRGT